MTEYALLLALVALAVLVLASLMGHHLAVIFCEMRAALEPGMVKICVVGS